MSFTKETIDLSRLNNNQIKSKLSELNIALTPEEGIKIQEEMAAVEKLKEAISKEMGTYGKNEVKTSLESGAAESILLISEKTKEKEGLELLELAQKNRTNVIEISSHHHGGEMLIGLGGIAVILRYKMT